jgi:hypothetical protein
MREKQGGRLQCSCAMQGTHPRGACDADSRLRARCENEDERARFDAAVWEGGAGVCVSEAVEREERVGC